MPTIRDLKDYSDRIARHELEKAHKKLAAGEAAEVVLEELARQIANKFMHAPLAALNNVLPEEQDAMLTTVRRLYRLHE